MKILRVAITLSAIAAGLSFATDANAAIKPLSLSGGVFNDGGSISGTLSFDTSSIIATFPALALATTDGTRPNSIGSQLSGASYSPPTLEPGSNGLLFLDTSNSPSRNFLAIAFQLPGLQFLDPGESFRFWAAEIGGNNFSNRSRLLTFMSGSCYDPTSTCVHDEHPGIRWTEDPGRISIVPIPAAGVLLLSAVGGLGMFSRRRRQAATAN